MLILYHSFIGLAGSLLLRCDLPRRLKPIWSLGLVEIALFFFLFSLFFFFWRKTFTSYRSAPLGNCRIIVLFGAVDCVNWSDT